MSDFIDIGALGDIPQQGARLVKTAAGCIAIFRTAEDKVFALDDKCPHKGGPLSNGIQHGEAVTCPLHNWVLDLKTGEAVGPDEGKAQTIPVKIEEGQVFIRANGASAARIVADADHTNNQAEDNV